MSAYNSYLGKRGHAILKKSLSVQEQKFIRDELTVRPYIPKSPAQPPKFPIYRESPNKLYLPRYFALDHFGPPTVSKVDAYERRPMKFAGGLRDYQEVIVNKYMSHVSQPHVGGGLLEVPCGRGKTCCALYIAAQLSVKTLVIVHKEFLLNQWVERINQFIPHAKIGRLQGQVLDIDDKCPIGIMEWSSTEITDFDSDGCLDSLEDADDDNDGVIDARDKCPGEIPPENYVDSDLDGCLDSTEIKSDSSSFLSRLTAGDLDAIGIMLALFLPIIGLAYTSNAKSKRRKSLKFFSTHDRPICKLQ